MKNAKKIYNIGQLLLVLGSALYVVELVNMNIRSLTLPISCIYAVSLILMLIGKLGSRSKKKKKKA